MPSTGQRKEYKQHGIMSATVTLRNPSQKRASRKQSQLDLLFSFHGEAYRPSQRRQPLASSFCRIASSHSTTPQTSLTAGTSCQFVHQLPDHSTRTRRHPAANMVGTRSSGRLRTGEEQTKGSTTLPSRVRVASPKGVRRTRQTRSGTAARHAEVSSSSTRGTSHIARRGARLSDTRSVASIATSVVPGSDYDQSEEDDGEDDVENDVDGT